MILPFLSEHLGASEPALRLLISLLIGYPILHVHRKVLKDSSPVIQHLYFILCGIGIAIFNSGSNVIHSMICIIAAWLVLLAIGGTFMSVVITFVFQMGYLLIGYYVTGTETYDIKWTMPHCVLTLRLIALAFDVYDARKPPGQVSKDQQMTILHTRPSLIEIAGQIYFPPSFMVGPQFSMRRYLDFVHQRLHPIDVPSPEMAGIKRGISGLIYLAVYQVGITWIPESYLLSDQFNESCYITKLLLLGLWGKITLYKYISCWLVTEGACIFCGLAYSGKNEDGTPVWKGCANVKVFQFETGTSFGILLKAWNTNTNNWVAHYVYKRMKFLNNVYVSQLGALMFLAVWHGLHSGYYSCFLMEFIIMYVEKNLAGMLNKYPQVVKTLESPPLSYILAVFLKLYTLIFMGYCLSSFVLLKRYKWWQFYKSVYFVGHLFFGSWILVAPVVKILLRKYGGPRLEKEKTAPPLEPKMEDQKQK